MDRRALLTVLGSTIVVGGCSSTSSAPPAQDPSGDPSAKPSPSQASKQPASPTPTPTPTFDTPGGMAPIGDGGRLVGWCGAPGAPGQGRLGVGDNLDQRTREMIALTKKYAADKPVVPVMELIATTVHASPGKDGTFRTRIDDSHIETWLATARKYKALLLLNIQPGRARFIDEVKAYEKWLLQPDVGVALDPEWSVQKGQIPGRVFGHTTGGEMNLVGDYLSNLVAKHHLPEKVLVFHQLNPGVVREESTMKDYPGVAWVKSVDGIGSPAAKVDTWKRVIATTPKFVHLGFKLFYEEDVKTGKRLMTPQEVLALKPAYVMYE